MNSLEESVLEKVNIWINGNYDESVKKELHNLLNQKAFTTLTDAFYKDLEFGTGGLRGIIGTGTNRINQYTLGMATQGLSNYLKKIYPNEQIKVVIAHDNRNNAEYFARITAEVFSANDIFVYFFDALRPTPELSFAIRELGCHSGIMLTASHNPKEYSGYKAYWKDGGQLIYPHDNRVIEEVTRIKSVDEVKFTGKDSLIQTIGKEMDMLYIKAIKALSISQEAIKRQENLKIVFSPIHGTGVKLVPDALKAFGFKNVILVEEQCVVDGNFPTVIYPNPEEKEALTMALNKAKETDADLVMATDPDADRVGIAIKNNKNEFILLNGNQTGCLLVQYMLNVWEKNGKLKGNEYIVKTIVTSYLMDKIAESKKVECYNVLTGFKFIGELISELENIKTFIVGGEESYGYLIGEHARDKDAVIACAMIAEMAAYYKDNSSSLFEALLDMYKEYGFYQEKLISVTLKGQSGAMEIQKMMDRFRNNPPLTLGNSKVVVIKDYEKSLETQVITNQKKSIDLPKSNVLQLITEDGSIVSARPSGTEPKIKFYCSVNTPFPDKGLYTQISEQLNKKIDTIIGDLKI
ncbi:MAG: phospho-sugar mutase [Bacteroidetes bacterium]|nr:phospho-sugar mutase [Bacteroidota bacterium]HET6244274.1 phospho-sugar mutase [Bacteroidia bacterium]